MERPQRLAYEDGDGYLLDYWEEYQKMIEETKLLDDYLDEECPRTYDADGEEEAEWLRAAGLGELTEAWKAGREVQPEELGAALRPLWHAHAEAVKRRVRSLNHTVKQRFNHRQRVRKPDIRDVFKDVEVSSTGTRSRSATPDSLDSIPGATSENASPPSPPTVGVIDVGHSSAAVPSFVSIFQRASNEGKEAVRRTPSAPSPSVNPVSGQSQTTLPVQEIFRRPGNWSRGDVANDSEGIRLTGYQRLGTIHVSRPAIQRRSGSDPSEVANTAHLDNESIGKLDVGKDSTLRRNSGGHATVTRSHSSLYGLTRPAEEGLITHPLNRTSSHGHLSFEEMCRANEVKLQVRNSKVAAADDAKSRHGVEMLSQREFIRLQPLLWLELTAVFDRYNVPLTKRKPNKRRAKAGNLFGVSLSTLLLRDSQLTSEENNIPLVFQKILAELTKRGVKEEGILRVGGHKQKVESICVQLETDFYCKPKEMDKLFKRTPCHDLSAVLKKLLRDLPQPLLTVELIDAFYQSHGVKDLGDLSYSLNLLVLLLPTEHRCTLKALLTFLKMVIENQATNKMSIHNVAMIVAPSFFPPRYVHPRDRTDLTAQVNMAAICCQVTEALLDNLDKLCNRKIVHRNQTHQEASDQRPESMSFDFAKKKRRRKKTNNDKDRHKSNDKRIVVSRKNSIRVNFDDDTLLESMIFGGKVNHESMERRWFRCWQFPNSPRVEIHDTDVDVSSQVLALRAKAKVAGARATTPGGSRLANDPSRDKTRNHLARTLRSRGPCIDQFGTVGRNKRLIVPNIEAPPIVQQHAELARTEVTVPLPDGRERERGMLDESRYIGVDRAIKLYAYFISLEIFIREVSIVEKPGARATFRFRYRT